MLMNFLRFFPVGASTACFLILSSGHVEADETFIPTPQEERPQPIPGTFEILETHLVHREGRTITFYLITQPQLTVVPKPAPKPLTAEEQVLITSRKGKALSQLSVGVTVYDHQVSEIHWNSPDGGKQHVAYSNIDFTYLAGIGDFDSIDTVYSTIFAVGNATRAAQTAASLAIPAFSTFPADLSVYYLQPNDTFRDADQETLKALDALHAYYDTNKAKIQQNYYERERKRIAQEQWIKNHPVVLHDEVRYVWRTEPAPATNQAETK